MTALQAPTLLELQVHRSTCRRHPTLTARDLVALGVAHDDAVTRAGVTDEADIGLFFKRMQALAGICGDAEWHLARFAR